MIREATLEDAQAIADIYNDAVLNTLAIWNEVTVDAENRIAWMQARAEGGFPVLVVEAEGVVAGYASYGPWRAFDGFRATVEHSVYVEKSHRGRGYADALMQAMIAIAKERSIHVMIAGIEAGNEASIKLHRKLGFGNEATLREVGQKFGRWLDLTFMELRLDQRPRP